MRQLAPKRAISALPALRAKWVIEIWRASSLVMKSVYCGKRGSRTERARRPVECVAVPSCSSMDALAIITQNSKQGLAQRSGVHESGSVGHQEALCELRIALAASSVS